MLRKYSSLKSTYSCPQMWTQAQQRLLSKKFLRRRRGQIVESTEDETFWCAMEGMFALCARWELKRSLRAHILTLSVSKSLSHTHACAHTGEHIPVDQILVPEVFLSYSWGKPGDPDYVRIYPVCHVMNVCESQDYVRLISNSIVFYFPPPSLLDI